jgi:hypothetical protein
MALRDIDEMGGMRDVTELEYWPDFEKRWRQYTDKEQRTIINAIDEKLDDLAAAPDSRWGSIMSTSIEGGKVNPFNDRPGDWTGTPWESIYEHSGQSEQQAGLFFGLLWKWRIIEHGKQWVGIRNDPVNRPTFPERGVTLQGKTYFLDRSQT